MRQLNRPFTPKRLNRALSIWAPILISLLLTILMMDIRFIIDTENRIHDYEAELTRTEFNNDVVLVEIGPQSLMTLSHWPWPRHYYATVLRNLAAVGAKDVFLDVDFSAKSDTENDQLLKKTLRELKLNVYMPAFLQRSHINQQSILTLSRPIAEFRDYVGILSVNLQQDRDGLVRYYTLRHSFAGEPISTYASTINDLDVSIGETVRINYRINPSSLSRVRFADILADKFDIDKIKDKHVIIGSTAVELGDLITVPVYQTLPGPVLQAMAYISISHGRLVEAGKITTFLSLVILALVSGYFIGKPGWRKGLRNYLIINTFLLLGSVLLHVYTNTIIQVVPLLVMSSLCFIASQLARIERKVYTIYRQNIDLRNNELMMSAIVDTTREAIITLDKRFKILTYNRSAREIFELSDTDNDLHIEDLIPDFDTRLQCINPDCNANYMNSTSITVDGDTLHIEYTLEKLSDFEDEHFTLFVNDVSDRKHHLEALEYQANFDLLTALRNRTSFVNVIEESLYHNYDDNHEGILFILNLNGLKRINDSLGHRTGDIVLKIIGMRLRKLENENVSVARLSGDEFAVLFNKIRDYDQYTGLYHTIRDRINKPITVSDMSLTISMVAGVARLPAHADTSDGLLAAASIALHRARISSRNYEIYDPAWEFHTKRNLKIGNDIQNAIDQNQLALVFQPKIDMRTHALVSFEALLRWHHPEIDMISPVEFIPLIEQSSLIKPVTLFTVEQAIIMQQQLNEAISVPVAINLSVKLLDDASIVDDIRDILRRYSVPAGMLELEITESVQMETQSNSMQTLQAFRQHGIPLSIDDFGTGNASISYLKQLPASELKIDKLFISNICNSKEDQLITDSIISLAHGLDLRVVAEGIEDEATYQFLRETGCDIGQGYFMSKPLPAGEIASWHRQWLERFPPSLTVVN